MSKLNISVVIDGNHTESKWQFSKESTGSDQLALLAIAKNVIDKELKRKLDNTNIVIDPKRN